MPTDGYDHRCPWRTDVLLSLFGFTEFDAAAERHLLTCAVCREPLEELVGVCDAADDHLDEGWTADDHLEESWHDDELPPGFEVRVVAAIAALSHRRQSRTRSRYCRRRTPPART